MSWTVAEIKNKLRPWIRSNQALFDRFSVSTEEQFLDILNSVARDLNVRTELRIERFRSPATVDETNYQLQGNVLRVYYFKYIADNWQDQYYAWVNDTIILKEAPTSADIILDIYYLRDTEDVSADADEIDLPVFAQFDFLELVKTKILIDFGDLSTDQYDAAIELRIPLIRRKQGNTPLDAIRSFARWTGGNSDDGRYDITDQIVTQDSVVALGDGTYEIITAS